MARAPAAGSTSGRPGRSTSRSASSWPPPRRSGSTPARWRGSSRRNTTRFSGSGAPATRRWWPARPATAPRTTNTRRRPSALGVTERAPPAGREIAERERADPRSHQAQRRMADRGGHAADLAVLALGQLQREPRVGHALAMANRRVARGERGRGRQEPRPARLGAKITEVEAAPLEAAERRGVGHALDLRPIFAGVPVLWIEEAGVEAGFVAQQQQALGVGIEAPEGVAVPGQREVRERAPARAGFGRELREHAVGFVQGDQHRAE